MGSAIRSAPTRSIDRPRTEAGPIGEAGRFGVVGAANTLLDFVLFHALTALLGVSLANVWTAKAISGTVAIANSFYLNRRWVFRADGRLGGQALRFVIATLIGVYVIQTGLTQVFATSLDRTLSDEFVIRSVAFVLATVFSLSWNFAAYKWWVFRRPR